MTKRKAARPKTKAVRPKAAKVLAMDAADFNAWTARIHAELQDLRNAPTAAKARGIGQRMEQLAGANANAATDATSLGALAQVAATAMLHDAADELLRELAAWLGCNADLPAIVAHLAARERNGKPTRTKDVKRKAHNSTASRDDEWLVEWERDHEPNGHSKAYFADTKQVSHATMRHALRRAEANRRKLKSVKAKR